MDLGVGADRLPGVEVDGLCTVGAELGRDLEPLVEQSLTFTVVVVGEHTDVMEPAFAGAVHLAVQRRRVVVLFDELDLDVAGVTEGVRHVGLDVLAAVAKPVGPMVRRQEERTGTGGGHPVVDRPGDVGDEERLLERNSNERHGVLLDRWMSVRGTGYVAGSCWTAPSESKSSMLCAPRRNSFSVISLPVSSSCSYCAYDENPYIRHRPTATRVSKKT